MAAAAMSRRGRRGTSKTAEQLAALARADEINARRRAERVEVERVAEVERLSAKTIANRLAVEGARVVGPLVITRADGERVEVSPPSRVAARRVIAEGQRQARAWHDSGTGRYGGGNDFTT